MPRKRGSSFPSCVCLTVNADLGRLSRTDFAPDGGRKQLMPQAYTQVRPVEIDNKFTDRGFFCDEPRIFVFLPDILRAAHDHHKIVGRNIWKRIAGVEFNRIPAQAIGFEEVPKNSGMLDVDVLQNENFHRPPPSWKAASTLTPRGPSRRSRIAHWNRGCDIENRRDSHEAPGRNDGRPWRVLRPSPA